MKKLFYSIAIAVVAAVGFSSCNNEFDEDQKYSYPGEKTAIPLGCYAFGNAEATENAKQNIVYDVILTENNAGDTVTTVILTESLSKEQFYSTGTKSNYDPVSGMMRFNGTTTAGALLFGANATLMDAEMYFAYNSTSKGFTSSTCVINGTSKYDLSNYTGLFSFVAKKVRYPRFLCGSWEYVENEGDGTTDVVIVINGYTEDGKLDVLLNVGGGEDIHSLANYDYKTGVLTFEGDAAEYSASFNEKGQLVFHNGDNNVVVDFSLI